MADSPAERGRGGGGRRGGGGNRGGRGGRGGGKGKKSKTFELPVSQEVNGQTAFEAMRSNIDQAIGSVPTEKILEVHCIKQSLETGADMEAGSALTNHFKITLPTKALYEYRIEGMITKAEIEADNKPSRDRRKTFKQLAISKSKVLSDQTDEFVSDDFGLIISWKDLAPREKGGLPVPGPVEEFSICLREPRDENDKGDFRDLQLLYTGQIPVDDFLKACEGNIHQLPLHTTDAKTLDVGHAMNIILSESTAKSGEPAFRMGTKKMFLSARTKDDIVKGVNIHEGYFSSVKYGMGHPLLNVRTTASVFWREIPLYEYLQERGCTRSVPGHIQGALKGVKVKVNYLSDRAKTIKAFGRRTPSQHTFLKAKTWKVDPKTNKRIADKTRSLTVYENLAEKKPALPTERLDVIKNSVFNCVNIGSTNRGKEEWYPVEELTIVGEQLYKGRLTRDAKGEMVSKAQCPPGRARHRVCNEAMRLLGVPKQNDSTSVLHKSSLSVDERMLKVPTRGINQPAVRIRDSEGVPVSARFDDKAKFNWSKSIFYNTEKKMKGPIVFIIDSAMSELTFTVKKGKKAAKTEGKEKAETEDEITETKPVGDGYAEALVASLESLGVQFDIPAGQPKHQVHEIEFNDKRSLADKFDDAMKTALSYNAALVVFVNKSSGDTDTFEEFKRSTDQRYGIQSMCMTDEAVRHTYISKFEKNSKTLDGHMANLAMKVNLKLGNINHSIASAVDDDEALKARLYDDDLLDTIILGADVVHTQEESPEGTPSLAAVVGSIDGHFSTFLGSMRAQEQNTEPITMIADMVVERLRAWSEHNPRKDGTLRLPKRIIYYRDGVGDGQYLEIRKTELVGIRKAYDKIQDDYENKGYLGTQGRFKPQLTAVVVTKRHHTRFFPFSEEEKVNCPPGTVVDSVVTHPCYFDFFLQSQYAPVGTAKPTYYFVLENDINFSPRQLQDFTNILCYSYVRATLPVGYVPATYYADRLCDRARCYLKDAYQALKKQLKDDAKEKKKQDKAKKQAAKRSALGIDTSRLAPADDDDNQSVTTVGDDADRLYDDSDDDVQDQSFLAKARLRAWYERYDANGGKDENPVGPWHRNLNGTMFWM